MDSPIQLRKRNRKWRYWLSACLPWNSVWGDADSILG